MVFTIKTIKKHNTIICLVFKFLNKYIKPIILLRQQQNTLFLSIKKRLLK